MRRQLPKNKEPEAKDNSLADQVKDLVQLITVRELQAIRRLDYQQQLGQPLPHPLPPSSIEPPPNSSPVRSETDHCEILSQFFNWLMAQPSHSSERQKSILQPIKHTLMADDWDINRIRSPKDITIELWKEYRFPVGTLPRIREKVAEFKRQRTAYRE